MNAIAWTAAVQVAAPSDPLTIVHHLEAWMPERVAAYKLRGFVQDVGGELIESVPGRIRVRLGGKNCVRVAERRAGRRDRAIPAGIRFAEARSSCCPRSAPR